MIWESHSSISVLSCARDDDEDDHKFCPQGNIRGTMPVASDLRKKDGARVHARAWDVTAHAECARRYGANQKRKRVGGTVISVRTDTSGQRASYYVTADYELGGSVIKRTELNLRRVTAGDPPAPVPSVVQLCTTTPGGR